MKQEHPSLSYGQVRCVVLAHAFRFLALMLLVCDFVASANGWPRTSQDGFGFGLTLFCAVMGVALSLFVLMIGEYFLKDPQLEQFRL